jgi:hypothetical protein
MHPLGGRRREISIIGARITNFLFRFRLIAQPMMRWK